VNEAKVVDLAWLRLLWV